MQVRIQLRMGGRVARKTGKNRHVAWVLAALLKPVALTGYVLGIWRLGSDMALIGQFPMTGVLSHWQVWMGLGVLTHVWAWMLNRYGVLGHMVWPRVLSVKLLPPSGQSSDVAPQVRRAAAGQ